MEITAKMVSELREKTGLGMMMCKEALQKTGGNMEVAIEDLRKQGQMTATKRAGKAAKEGKVSVITTESFGLAYEVNCETDFVARNEDFLAFIQNLGTVLCDKKPSDIASASALKEAVFGNVTLDEKITELIGKIGEKLSFRRFVFENAIAGKERVFSYVHGNGKIGVLVKLSADKPEALSSDALAALGKDLAMQVAATNPIALNRDSFPKDLITKEKEIYLDVVKTSGKPEKIWDKIVEGKLSAFFEENALIEQKFIRDPEKKVVDRITEAGKETGATITALSFIRYELGAEA
jgi:elongation factor Ts